MDNGRMNTFSNKQLFALWIGVIFFLLSINLSSANLGTWKQNDCVSIRVLSNCTNVNISEVTTRTKAYILNKAMANLAGQTFNYTFCNTSDIGIYTYSWNPSCLDCSSSECGNYFEVTESGTKVSLSNIIIVIVFLFLGGLCFFMGSAYNSEKWMIKSFFYLVALLFGVISVNSARIIASESQDLFKMSTIGLLLIIVIVLAMFLYTFIYYMINTFKQMKEKREIRWKY
jgi:hypothetical protein